MKKQGATIDISFECTATLTATNPHQRATPAPKAMAIGFLTEIVQHHNIHTDITPPKIAGIRLDGNGPLIKTISAERILSGMPKRRNCLVFWVLPNPYGSVTKTRETVLNKSS
jgi:hypothetical protein